MGTGQRGDEAVKLSAGGRVFQEKAEDSVNPRLFKILVVFYRWLLHKVRNFSIIAGLLPSCGAPSSVNTTSRQLHTLPFQHSI